ncbi:MAG: right-handed parallel beta-helix repeat-containing protein [Candidatus Hermodarchaeota archaeon]
MNLPKKITIILVTLTFISLLTNRVNLYSNLTTIEMLINSENQTEKNLKSSGFWNLTGTPIFIDGDWTGIGAHNWTWFENQTWYGGGNGTLENPYIIENITIDGQGLGNCIEIRDSNDYFIIRNCTLSNSGPDLDENGGIKLMFVNNGKLIKNNCSNNKGNGILLKSGKNNNISGNIINNNTSYGLKTSIGENHIITLNNISNNNDGIYLANNPGTNIIAYNSIYNNYNNGIRLVFTRRNNILNNKIYNNDKSGILITEGLEDFLYNNEIYNNDYSGVEMDSCSGIMTSKNNISRNEYGIHLEDKGYNQFFENNISSNIDTGILLMNSEINNITNNNIIDNAIGIYLENSNYTDIMENKINNNTKYGLYLVKSNYNYVYDNDVCDNFVALEEEECEGNKFKNNKCIDKNGFPPEIVMIIVISIAGAMVAVGLYVFRKRSSREKLISRTTLSSQELEELRKTEAEVSVEKEYHTCVVHRGKIVGAVYICPKCETYYCMKCATVLKKKGETCWSCNNKIELE